MMLPRNYLRAKIIERISELDKVFQNKDEESLERMQALKGIRQLEWINEQIDLAFGVKK
jgi:hypothetical protein